MQKNKNEQKSEYIFYNQENKDKPKITTNETEIKDSQKTEFEFYEPKKAFNFIEKQMRKSSKYSKFFINTKYAEALTIETEEIPNSLYLTKINEKETILGTLIKRYGNFFKDKELEKRIKNPEILDIIYEYILNLESIEKNNIYIITEMIKKIPTERRLTLYKKHFKKLKNYISDSSLKQAIIDYLDSDTIKYLIEIQEFEFLKKLTPNKLTIKYDKEKTLFNFLEQNKIINIETDYAIFSSPEIIKILIENNKFNEIKKITKNNTGILLNKYDDTHTLLNLLLNNPEFTNTPLESKITEYAKHNIKFAKIYSEYYIYAPSLLDADKKILETKKDEYNTILESILSTITLAIPIVGNKYYKYIASHKISKYALLQKIENKTLLELLLQNCEKTIIANLHVHKMYENVEIQTILKLNGIDIKKEFGENTETKFNIEDSFKIKKTQIIKERYIPYLKGKINNKQQMLLEELRKTFKEDGRSDDEIIELACNSFKFLFTENYEYAQRDLKSLINIKKNNPEFIMIKGNRSKFDDMGLLIMDEIYDIDTFNHELTHAIHWYTSEWETPETFKNKTFEIDEKKYNIFIKQYASERMEITEKLKRSNIDYYSENEKAQKEANNYKKRIENILDDAEKNNSYSKEIIDYLKNNIIIEEEYKEYYNRISTIEMTFLYHEEYKSAIIDIIDALKKGKIYDDGIKAGDIIIKIGHGSEYYGKEKKVFPEIIAEYTEIIKSPYKEEGLKILEGIVGKELIEILEHFNKELIVEPLENKKQK